jgi:uncharacterized membrane protein (UPF0127 family)
MRLRVYNATRERLLAERAERADTFVRRLVGWMGRARADAGEGLLIVPCNAIHTFFMRMPIDVVFLDAQDTVVRLLHALPPWRATRPCPGARAVLELPAGTLATSGTREGDRLVVTGGHDVL